MSSIQPFLHQLDTFSTACGLAAGVFLSLLLSYLATVRLRKNLFICEVNRAKLNQEVDNHQEMISRLRLERDRFRNEYETMHRQTVVLQTRLAGLEEQEDERKILLETIQKELTLKFELLAGDILTEKGSLVKQQHESALQQLLQPFHTQLKNFRQKVDDVYDKETRDRSAITTEIKHLRNLNEKLSTDAVNLTEALQGKNKLQGQWGEMVLERLLEQSGLRKEKEFSTQKSFTTKSGTRKQPDVIIHLPEARDIIIDSKVSLKAFAKAYNEKDSAKSERHLKEHIESIKQHITGLAAKKYHQLEEINTVDFVFLFIPVEGAFQAAVDIAPDIITKSMHKNIILCSPSTLLAVLRTIHHLWRQDEQNKNGLIIAKHAGNLYDKFVGFIETFEEIGTRLEQSQRAWFLAKKRLIDGKGNLVQRVNHLKELGIQTDRDIKDVLKTTTPSEEK